jgi:hypothetical protein
MWSSCVLAQEGEVGQHQVDAEHVELGEHQPHVEQQDAPVDLEARAVAPDLAESPEEGDAYRARHVQRTYRVPVAAASTR